MSSTPDLTHLGIVILNWNGAQQTLECLRSLTTLTSVPKKILVIDNGSVPAQDQQLKTEAPLAVTCLRSDTNLGFAGGMNLGIRTLLTDSKIQSVLLLNNDTVVTAEALPQLLQTLQQPRVGLVGARMLRMDHPDKIENRGLGISSWGLAWNITQPDITPSLAGGGCLLLKRHLIEQLISESTSGGVFDERLFLYFEDVDLGLRARALGWKGVTNDLAIVQHTGGGSTQASPDIPLYYWHRNSIWVVLKNFPTITLMINVIPMVMLHLAVAVLYTFKGQGGVVWKAKWDAIKGLSYPLRQRRARLHTLKYADFQALKQSNWSALRNYFA